MKKFLSLMMAALMMAVCLTACGSDASSTASQATSTGSGTAASEAQPDNYLDKEPLRVATITAQMGVYLQYALDNGLFEDAGINVEMFLFDGAVAINEAVGAGELDGCIGGLGSVYALSSNQLVLLSELDSVNADGIVVRNDSDILTAKGEIEGKPDMYGSAETLRGKSFICQVGQAQQFYVSKYISQFGLTENDISFVNMEVASSYQAFVAGEGDAISTKMPYIYDLVNDNDCTIVADVKDATDIEIKDPVMFTPEAIENRREEVKIFLKVIHGVVDEMQADPELRKTAITDFYTAVGKDTQPEYLDYELEQNTLIDTKRMGDGFYAVGEFYVSTGTIPEADLPNILANIDTSLVSEALGFEVKAFEG
ncbi:ABC transporter substrate-binding protein [uncultured Ruthenibacterium sp.]|uniref:ABC transporter substrate-binding protein n=1 Tax=uncultured Ruthenibacterium sp. TaxID=1905347 RepID=UPI00349E9E0B